MIEGISSSQTESPSMLSQTGGVGSASFSSGGQHGQGRTQSFGDVLDVSAQARAQATRHYQQNSVRGQQPDIAGFIQQAQQAAYNARAQVRSTGTYNFAHMTGTQEGYMHSQMQKTHPQRAAATYKTVQSQGVAPKSLAPWGTGIAITV